jgi:3-methyladenine DNA glycosylase AlkD
VKDGKSAVRFFRKRFVEIGAPDRAAGERAYMKSELEFHGVTTPQLRATCGEFSKAHPAATREELLAWVEALYATQWFDLRSAGVVLLERKLPLLEERDVDWLVTLVRKSGNWAQVDYLATKIVGGLLSRYPKLAKRLPGWAKDDDFWVRRTALLAQLGQLRRGGGDFALFARLAVPMLEEREFFIRKAIGWVLREVSKKRPELVRAFLEQHGARCSGVTLREARKYLS